jgi:hypothetical protein
MHRLYNQQAFFVSSFRGAVQSKDAVYSALGEALDGITLQDILGWFQQAGLCAMHQ